MRKLRRLRRSLASTLLAAGLLTGAAALLSACNTTAGFGEDMQDAGQAVTNSAHKVENGQ